VAAGQARPLCLAVPGSCALPKCLDRIFYRAIRRCVVARRAQRSREVADRIAFMADGGIVEYGPPKKALDNPRVGRTRGFLRKSTGAYREGRAPVPMARHMMPKIL
jgi:hypothetical protein